MKKVCVCGNFSCGKKNLNGQSVKTESLYNSLGKMMGKERVGRINTHNWSSHPFRLLGECLKAALSYKNIVILPGQNGVKIFPLLFLILQKFSHFKLHYSVIGAWIAEMASRNVFLRSVLRKIDVIYTETSVLQCLLNEVLAAGNSVVMHNFKDLPIVSEEGIREQMEGDSDIVRCCMFSRVSPLKGVNDAIDAVEKVNSAVSSRVCLDIYGSVASSDAEWFDALNLGKRPGISYKGIVDPENSVDVLKNYDVLLFPTRSFTEGIPGTIIDAYAAGLPVIASAWESSAEIVKDGVTGFVYPFNDKIALVNSLRKFVCMHDTLPTRLLAMKFSCIGEAEKYQPDCALKTMLARLI